MCGIAGIWHLDGTGLPAGKLERFTDAMKERGPDDAGYDYFDNSTLGLGHRRLSILDLSPAGRQPFYYGEKRFSIIFNGEVFNFLELREELKAKGYAFNTESDTEVVLAAYQEWGKDCLPKFNGMWALAIWDERENQLFVARDRFGIKPLYYVYEPGKIFAFASETRNFKSLEGYTRSLDLHNVKLQAEGARIHGSGHSIYKGIQSILPGHFTQFRRNEKMQQKRWWNIHDYTRNDVAKDLNSQAEEFYALFKDACKLRLISDVNVGTALSGGLDSSAVYSVVYDLIKNESLTRLPKEAQTAFVATFPGLISDEREYAEKALTFTNGPAVFLEQNYENLAEQVFNDTVIFDGLNNAPITSISGIYKGMKQNGITVSMDGHGVDEMLYGYRDMLYNLFYHFYKNGETQKAKLIREVIIPTYHELEKDQALNNLNNMVKSADSPIYKFKAMVKKLLGKTSLDRTSYMVPESLQNLGEPYNFGDMDYADRIVYNETFLETLPDIFRNFDLAGMMNSVEIRMPFMDWRLVSYLFSLPMESKIGNGFTKLIVREAMKGKMSEEIRTRTHKIGISSPVEHWFRGALKPWVLDFVSSNEFKQTNYLVDKDFSEKLISAYKNNTLTKQQITQAWMEINLHIIN